MKRSKNYAVMFLLLSSASVSGGIGLHQYVEYAPTIGYGLAFLFLLAAAFTTRKKTGKKESFMSFRPYIRFYSKLKPLHVRVFFIR
ncbi:hypothetical protein QUF84_26300 [Fictibacillus enclensis]|uniref:hypothetical protein n=1 Tax=Fictibacillus enclensis TaxID=1017270 RepID=UPI0025A1F00B|nr:hypothetical protein [Fictibacillus enclensis]MDM5340704.1 hypothetical protein [Fictibacillus enclensis]